MQKKTEYLLVAFFLLLAIFARTAFWEEGRYGSDLFYHYTVTEQSLEKGFLDARNDLAYCYEGVPAGHPIGYYSPAYFGAKLFGLDTSFIVIPVFLGLLSLLLGYFLVKRLFNRKVALITLFLASISLAHVSKSYPFSYRGDNIILPLLFGSLLLLHLAFSVKEFKKRALYASLAGVVSAFTVFFWNGYPFVLIIFATTLCLYILFKFFKKEKIRADLQVATVSITIQAIVFYTLFSLLELYSKGLIFGREYYYLLVLGLFAFFFALFFSEKKKSFIPLLVYIGLGLVSIPLFWDKILNVLGGFGSIQAQGRRLTTAIELMNTSLGQMYTVFFILIITSLIGIYFFIKRFNKESAFFLGLLLPCLYLVSSAVRFMFLASIPILVLTAIFLDNKKILKKKFDIFFFLTMVVVISMIFWAIYVFPPFFSINTPDAIVEGYEFLKENSPADACIISLQQRGAMVEMFAKRHYYFHSLGFNLKRSKEVYSFWLTNAKPEFEVENPYILVTIGDVLYIPLLNDITNLSNIEMDTNVAELYNGAWFAQNANKVLVRVEGNKSVRVAKVDGEVLTDLRTVFIDGEIYHNPEGEGCLLGQGESFIFFNDKLCDANMFKMVTQQEIDGMEKVYAKNNVVIYKVL